MIQIRYFDADSTFCGCLFHFAQILWRKLQNEGLSEDYKAEENESLRREFHCLIALAFEPERDVENAFDELWATSEEESLQPLFEHVEDNYVKGKRRGRGRSAPAFPPKLWNCYERVLEDLPRTTNTAEAWHRRLNLIVGKHHPSFYVLLDQLKDEVEVINAEVTRAEGGHSPPRKRTKYEDTDKRIARVVDRYATYKEDVEVIQYLKAIGSNLAGNIGDD